MSTQAKYVRQDVIMIHMTNILQVQYETDGSVQTRFSHLPKGDQATSACRVSHFMISSRDLKFKLSISNGFHFSE